MVFIFWLCVSLILWVYAGYPLLLWVKSRLLPAAPVARCEIEPPVTLLISAYNEAAVIRRKLENSLALDYPPDKLEIIVISDCSDDGTDDIVRTYAGRGVRLLRMPARGGKTAGLNAALPTARGEIVIFSDANAMYDPATVRRMVRNFADARVGCVTGESRYHVSGASQSSESENLYWRYELALKKMESAAGSLVGGDGAIYAIRKSLFKPMQPSDLSDFVNPLQITAQGYRNVYEPEAVSYEDAGDTFAKEFQRKVRIVNRAWRGLWRVAVVLNPLRYGFFALQVVSHKLLRWLVPVFMAGALLSNAFLLTRSPFYLLTGIGQALFYLLALLGWRQAHRRALPRAVYVPYYFCLVNYASLLGILTYYRGQSFTMWQTVRDPAT
ncbi:MAG: glycosyltransferase family 2 protein [candidate division KSB1 bacterium]|nr:glycosyltransferase family 2 protein [candidate division KSB1 bacterium]MDZ7272782.1 glycosyltransferase family 2 protein [candidate division KSB1 bacterium]MDZ7284194.1 glycosyltransferase family 2 protein [candidate division KSB1 bacterium]MDZ7297408.1 glycosyltransferase family 2 protein [candidate division KSB1 bacterium]MDZ7306532.1 glycosyltransferase family 2 protein [candidate division KSB1 bacterium]